MEKERLVVLQAEIKAQIQGIEGIYTRIEDRKRRKDKAAMESVGYQLHNLYCAFEDLFKIVAETFENHIQDKNKYHQELLKRMAISIERPLKNDPLCHSRESGNPEDLERTGFLLPQE